MNAYLALKQAQQNEMNNFPMMFAFSQSQFVEGMKILGLKETDADKIYAIGGGGYIRKTDAPALKDMGKRHEAEMTAAISGDETGDGFIFQMFDYELANHEYSYTGDIDDTLDALCLTVDDIANNIALKRGLLKAMKSQREYAAFPAQ